jgi:phage shock protein A
MGLFKRLHRITIGRIEAFLSRVEDPETLFPVLVKEMEDQLTAATEAEAKAMATLKGCEREVSKHEETVQRYENGALNAVKQGDEETARQAVKAQISAEKSSGLSSHNLETAKVALERARAARVRIQQQLEELQMKKGEILTRARVAKTQKKIQATVSGSVGSGDSILDAVARLEAQVEETEAELEIQQALIGEGTASQSLESKLEELDNEAEIQKRLDELKKRASNQ